MKKIVTLQEFKVKNKKHKSFQLGWFDFLNFFFFKQKLEEEQGQKDHSNVAFIWPSKSWLVYGGQGTIYRNVQLRYMHIMYCTLWKECKQTNPVPPQKLKGKD